MRRKTVMVIEDDPEYASTLSEALQHGGYRVVTAADGREALRELEANPLPVLILLDLTLPDMDGWQFLDERRARPALARIPVVLLSAALDSPRPAPELAVAKRLRKPVGLDELLTAVRNVVGPPG